MRNVKKEMRDRGVDAPSTDHIDRLYGLTIRQSAFVHQYLKCDHGSLAAVKAGYAPSTARKVGEALLSRASIQDALRARRQALAIETGVTAQDVINELKKVAFANMHDYMSVDEDGEPCLNLEHLTRDQAAALSETNTERYTEGKGKNARPVKKAKVKMHDKIAALGSLGKILGIFKENVEHTGKDGGAIAHRWRVEIVPCPKPNQPEPRQIQ